MSHKSSFQRTHIIVIINNILALERGQEGNRIHFGLDSIRGRTFNAFNVELIVCMIGVVYLCTYKQAGEEALLNLFPFLLPEPQAFEFSCLRFLARRFLSQVLSTGNATPILQSPGLSTPQPPN